MIAGKGHEDYQIIGRQRLPFSDLDEAARAMREAGFVVENGAGS